VSTVKERIDAQRVAYLRETGREPKYVFLGSSEISQLDRAEGQLVFRYKDMDVVEVIRSHCLVVGDKLVVREET
jgi:hypothetical protein